MDISKAQIILNLLKNENQLIRGLREIKKRLYYEPSNISVFRKLGLVHQLLKLIQRHNTIKIKTQKIVALENDEELDDLDPEQLEFEDLQRLKQLHNLSNNSTEKHTEPKISYAEKQQCNHISIEDTPDPSPESAEVLLYCTGLLASMTADYNVKLQCETLHGVVSLLLPLLHHSSLGVVCRAARCLTNIALTGMRGRGHHTFLAQGGPAMLVRLLDAWQENFDVIVLRKTLITSVRLMAGSSDGIQAVLSAGGVERVCSVGLTCSNLYAPALHAIAAYTGQQRHRAVVIDQVLTGTKELVLLLRVWQDNKECSDIHNYTVQVVQQLVQCAVVASAEQHHAAARVSPAHTSGYANMVAGRERLVKALFGSKAATALATEMVDNSGGTVSASVVCSLCTLCDGSLERDPSAAPALCSPGVSLVWLQVVEAGGVAPLMALLQSGPPLPGNPEEEDTARLQLWVLKALEALENNYSIQDKVLKHCLAANLLPALAQHFDGAFTSYHAAKRPVSELRSCVHDLNTATHDHNEEEHGDEAHVECPARRRRLHGLQLDVSHSRCPRSLSPPVVHPLAPISPPHSPTERPPLVYTPYSPPHTSVPASSTHFKPISTPDSPMSMSPDSSPPRSPIYSPANNGGSLASSSSSYNSGIRSPSLSPSRSPSCSSYGASHSPSYSPSHSPSYSPIHPSGYSPSYSPIHPAGYCLTLSSCPPSSYVAAGHNDPSKSSTLECSSSARADLARRASSSRSSLSPERSAVDKSVECSPPCVKRYRSSSVDVCGIAVKRLKLSSSVAEMAGRSNNNNKNHCETIKMSVEEDTSCGIIEDTMGNGSLLHANTSNVSQHATSKSTLPGFKICEDTTRHSRERHRRCDSRDSRRYLASNKNCEVRKEISVDAKSTVKMNADSVEIVVREIGKNCRDIECDLHDCLLNTNCTEGSLISEKNITKDFNLQCEDLNDLLNQDSTSNHFEGKQRQQGKEPARDKKHKDCSSEPLIQEANTSSLTSNSSKATYSCMSSCSDPDIAAVADECRVRLSSVQVREFNHIKFRVGSGNKPQKVESSCSSVSEPKGRDVLIREINHIKFCVGSRNKTRSGGSLSPSTTVREGGECRTSQSLTDKKATAAMARLPPSPALLRQVSRPTHRRPGRCDAKTAPHAVGKDEEEEEEAMSKGRLTSKEKECLMKLEQIVRIIAQVCQIQEALSGVCREFLPRIMLYLRHAQVVHPAATRALLTITRTPCSIQPMLDTLFPAYVSVQLCEAGIAKTATAADCITATIEGDVDAVDSVRVGGASGSECSQCVLLSSGGHAFLSNIRRYFGHVHQYGTVEARNRLRPNVPPHARETCLLNLPHVTSCPSLLHSLLVVCGGLQDLFSVVGEAGTEASADPASARYMYGTAALHALAHTLQLSSDGPLVRSCVLCLLRSSNGNSDILGQIDVVTPLPDSPVSGNAKMATGSGGKHRSTSCDDSTADDCVRTAVTDAGLCERCRPSRCVWADTPDKDLKMLLPQTNSSEHDERNEYSDEVDSDTENFPKELEESDCPTQDFFSDKDGRMKSPERVNDTKVTAVKPSKCSSSTEGVQKDQKPKQEAVWAHRSVLCRASGVWACMLGTGGDWRECVSSEVHMGGDISLPCLRAVVHHLYGCTCSALCRLSLPASIQLLHACHMYGLPRLQQYAARQVVLSCRTGADVVSVYRSGVGRVQESVITAVLVQLVTRPAVPTWRRARWLHHVASSEHGADLLHNLYTILHSALLARSTVCNCDVSQSLYRASNAVYSRLV